MFLEGSLQKASAEVEESPAQTGRHSNLAAYLRHTGAAVISLSMLMGEADAATSVKARTPLLADTPSRERSEQEHKRVNFEIIQNVAEHGPSERAFVCKDLSLEECYPLADSGTSGRVVIGIEEIMEIAEREGWKKLVLVHTHNMHDYDYIGLPGIVEGYDQKGLLRESTPPSCVDLVTYNTLSVRLKANNFEVTEAVAGTTGVWEYSVHSGPWEKALHVYDQALKEAVELVLNSNDPEAGAVGDVLNEPKNILGYIAALEKIMPSNAFARKVHQIFVTHTKPGADFESLVNEYEWRQLALGILRSDSDSLVLEAARRSFIHYAASLGIQAKFTPYPKSKALKNSVYSL